MKYKHALVIGGTGMLRETCQWLTSQADKVSVVARKSKVLDQAIHFICVDYTNSHVFKKMVSEASEQYGSIDLIVAWVHDTAPTIPLEVARLVHNGSKCEYYHVLGSAAARPDNTSAVLRKQFGVFGNISYHQVILGFVNEGSGSRWLTNTEISSGVNEAIQKQNDVHIVGVVDPWSARP